VHCGDAPRAEHEQSSFVPTHHLEGLPDHDATPIESDCWIRKFSSSKTLDARDSVGTQKGQSEPFGCAWASTYSSTGKLCGPAKGDVYQGSGVIQRQKKIVMVANKTKRKTKMKWGRVTNMRRTTSSIVDGLRWNNENSSVINHMPVTTYQPGSIMMPAVPETRSRHGEHCPCH
jgi:hypothetical protein